MVILDLPKDKGCAFEWIIEISHSKWVVFLHRGKLYPPRAPTRNNFKHRGQCPSLLDKQLGTSIPTIGYNMGSIGWQCRAVLPDHDVAILTSLLRGNLLMPQSRADVGERYTKYTPICGHCTVVKIQPIIVLSSSRSVTSSTGSSEPSEGSGSLSRRYKFLLVL